MACTTCHQVHVGKRPELVEKAPKKTVGTAACLTCHSDRPAMREFAHRPHVESLLGCETCHGAGREHAESRGAAGTMVDLRTAEPSRADRACMLCHQGFGAPEHFTPSPEMEKCVDCHRVHPEEKVVAPTPGPTPGRPPFRIELEEEPPAPAVPSFPMPAAPSDRVPGRSFFGVDWGGEFTLGGRVVDVDGNEDVYDQDHGLDDGFGLFDFALDGRLASDPKKRFHFSGSGFQDPVEHYRLDIRDEGVFTLTGAAKVLDLDYAATGDFRANSTKRTDIGLELTVFPLSAVRVTALFDAFEREGRRKGARFFGSGRSRVEEPFHDTGYRAGMRVEWTNGPVTVSLLGDYRFEDLEAGIRSSGSRAAPASSLMHDAWTDLSAPSGTLLFSVKPTDDVAVDGSFFLGAIQTETDLQSRETGPTGGGFVERTRGEVDGERDLMRAELGGSWYACPDVRITARVAGLWDDVSTEGALRTTRDEPPGTTISTDRERPLIDRDQERLRTGADVRWGPVPWGAILAGYEVVWADKEITGTGEKDGSNRIHGPLLGIDLMPTKDLTVNALYRFMRVTEPYTPVSAKDHDTARLRARWQAMEELSVTGWFTHSRLTNPALDADALSRAWGLSGIWTMTEDLDVDLTYDDVEYDSESDAVRFLAGAPVVGKSVFRSHTRSVVLGATWRATPHLRFRGGWLMSWISGNFPIDLVEYNLGAEYDLRTDLRLGTTFSFRSYNEEDVRRDDYDALRWDLWFKFSF
jgi:predicted CXXCH cytochrome family protein